eukprot:403350499
MVESQQRSVNFTSYTDNKSANLKSQFSHSQANTSNRLVSALGNFELSVISHKNIKKQSQTQRNYLKIKRASQNQSIYEYNEKFNIYSRDQKQNHLLNGNQSTLTLKQTSQKYDSQNKQTHLVGSLNQKQILIQRQLAQYKYPHVQSQRLEEAVSNIQDHYSTLEIGDLQLMGYRNQSTSFINQNKVDNQQQINDLQNLGTSKDQFISNQYELQNFQNVDKLNSSRFEQNQNENQIESKRNQQHFGETSNKFIEVKKNQMGDFHKPKSNKLSYNKMVKYQNQRGTDNFTTATTKYLEIKLPTSIEIVMDESQIYLEQNFHEKQQIGIQVMNQDFKNQNQHQNIMDLSFLNNQKQEIQLNKIDDDQCTLARSFSIRKSNDDFNPNFQEIKMPQTQQQNRLINKQRHLRHASAALEYQNYNMLPLDPNLQQDSMRTSQGGGDLKSGRRYINSIDQSPRIKLSIARSSNQKKTKIVNLSIDPYRQKNLVYSDQHYQFNDSQRLVVFTTYIEDQHQIQQIHRNQNLNTQETQEPVPNDIQITQEPLNFRQTQTIFGLEDEWRQEHLRQNFYKSYYRSNSIVKDKRFVENDMLLLNALAQNKQHRRISSMITQDAAIDKNYLISSRVDHKSTSIPQKKRNCDNLNQESGTQSQIIQAKQIPNAHIKQQNLQQLLQKFKRNKAAMVQYKSLFMQHQINNRENLSSSQLKQMVQNLNNNSSSIQYNETINNSTENISNHRNTSYIPNKQQNDLGKMMVMSVKPKQISLLKIHRLNTQNSGQQVSANV